MEHPLPGTVCRGNGRDMEVKYRWLLGRIAICLLTTGMSTAGAQVNDNCANADVVAIANAGYGVGTFTSATVNLTSATV